MKKINNMQNIQKECEKKSYKGPQLKEIGKVNDVTKKNAGGTVEDNPHNSAHLS